MTMLISNIPDDRRPLRLLAALALIQIPSDFCGCPLGGSIFERGAAGEHSLVIGVYFPRGYGHPLDGSHDRGLLIGRGRRLGAVASAAALPILLARKIGPFRL